LDGGVEKVDARNALSARDSHIWTLRIGALVLSLTVLFLLGIIYSKQNVFRIQVPPDLSKGAIIKPGEYLASNSYMFAHHIWRELNDWKVSGKVDYAARIKTYECYVTPAFKRWLEKNYAEKNAQGELDRTRVLSTIKAFDESMVIDMGNNTYRVDLHMNLTESIKNSDVKNISIRYPLRVLPDTRSCNLFGQSLDGFYAEPDRIDGVTK
jgi:integrating conjugative element protein (TIGR03746 family)